jgi:hypothetical protein
MATARKAMIARDMVSGRLYEANTLSEVWPRVRPLSALWFWSDVAAAGEPGRGLRDDPGRR